MTKLVFFALSFILTVSAQAENCILSQYYDNRISGMEDIKLMDFHKTLAVNRPYRKDGGVLIFDITDIENIELKDELKTKSYFSEKKSKNKKKIGFIKSDHYRDVSYIYVDNDKAATTAIEKISENSLIATFGGPHVTGAASIYKQNSDGVFKLSAICHDELAVSLGIKSYKDKIYIINDRGEIVVLKYENHKCEKVAKLKDIRTEKSGSFVVSNNQVYLSSTLSHQGIKGLDRESYKILKNRIKDYKKMKGLNLWLKNDMLYVLIAHGIKRVPVIWTVSLKNPENPRILDYFIIDKYKHVKHGVIDESNILWLTMRNEGKIVGIDINYPMNIVVERKLDKGISGILSTQNYLFVSNSVKPKLTVFDKPCIKNMSAKI